MSKHCYQIDRLILRDLQKRLITEPREDRRLLIVASAYVVAQLDHLVPKRPQECHSPSARVHELVTTWPELATMTSWPGEITSLRACLDRLVPHFFAITIHDGTRKVGIRILRLDHAGQGLLHDVEGKPWTLDSAQRLAQAEAYLRWILRCMDPTDPTEAVADISEPLTRLFRLVQEGPNAQCEEVGEWTPGVDWREARIPQVAARIRSLHERVRPRRRSPHRVA